MLFRSIFTEIEHFHRESRYTVILVFKHLQVQIIRGSNSNVRGQLSGGKHNNSSIAFFMFYILNVILFSILNFMKTGIGQ